MDFEISETLIIAVTAENIIYSISSNPKSDVKIVSVNIFVLQKILCQFEIFK